jgi:hypothetical protein
VAVAAQAVVSIAVPSTAMTVVVTSVPKLAPIYGDSVVGEEEIQDRRGPEQREDPGAHEPTDLADRPFGCITEGRVADPARA